MPRTDSPDERIRALRAGGIADAVILARLAIEGWPENVLRDALGGSGAAAPYAAVHSTPLAAPNSAPVIAATGNMPPRRHVSYVTGALAGALALALGFGIYTLYRPPVVYSISIPTAATTSAQLAYGALPALEDPLYYERVKQKFIAEKASFIDANLSSMELAVYTDGELKLTVPILAKGKVGSWWETPAGVYEIQTREKNHFSSFGKVYQPYSMQFQGNFFIHGWPYYEDGTPVSTSYSGGCIRLSTEDAEKVFGLAAVGEPVIVYSVTNSADTFQYQMNAPKISANEYIVADVNTGAVLASKNATDEAPIASVTKLVTALVATEYINLDKKITVPPEAIVYTSVPRLRSGAEVRVYDLLFLLLMESSNEAAETIASAVGRNAFVAHMNDKAQAIRLLDTSFVDPSGAKVGNVSTPEDMFRLLRYIYQNRRFVFDITAGKIADSAYGPPAFRGINNFNKLPGEPWKLVGGKVGETNAAGRTYAGIFAVKIGGAERHIAVIVLGSNDEFADVKTLLGFVTRSYAPADGTQ